MRIYNIYVLYVFDTLPQQLIENHIKNQKHPQTPALPILLSYFSRYLPNKYIINKKLINIYYLIH